MKSNIPREGDVFDVVCVGGHQFTIRYGYYEEEERGKTDPIPIFPCFVENPMYTEDGQPLVTRIQDACEYYITLEDGGDAWCADCIHCISAHDEIGICSCAHRRKQEPLPAV